MDLEDLIEEVALNFGHELTNKVYMTSVIIQLETPLGILKPCFLTAIAKNVLVKFCSSIILLFLMIPLGTEQELTTIRG